MPLFRLRIFMQKLTFSNISVITEDIYLKLRIVVHYQIGKPIPVGEVILYFFLTKLCPVFSSSNFHAKTLTFSDISLITEDIYLKLRIVVHYQKGNPYQ